MPFGDVAATHAALLLHDSNLRLGGVWKDFIATVNGGKEINQRLYGLNSWVLSTSVDELPYEADRDASSLGDGVKSAGSCVAQPSL